MTPLSLVLVFAIVAAPCPAQAQQPTSLIPPPNDDCWAPIALPAGPLIQPFDSSLATTGAQGQTEILCLDYTTTAITKDLWYTWTPTQTGPATLSTCGFMTSPSANADTKLAVYVGTGCPAVGSAIACNDDSGHSPSNPVFACIPNNLNSAVTFSVTCGQTFLLQIGQYPLNPGNNIGAFQVTENGTTCSTVTTPTTPFCLGDGTGVPCPCTPIPNNGAAGHGCASATFPGGALLSTAGSASDETSGTDTLVLTATDVPGPALFIQSSGLSAPLVFGDGQLCATSGIIRLGVVFPGPPAYPVGEASYPGGLTPNEIHLQGLATNGQTKHYQAWYRSVPGVCTAGQNHSLTQGLSLTWGL